MKSNSVVRGTPHRHVNRGAGHGFRDQVPMPAGDHGPYTSHAVVDDVQPPKQMPRGGTRPANRDTVPRK